MAPRTLRKRSPVVVRASEAAESTRLEFDTDSIREHDACSTNAIVGVEQERGMHPEKIKAAIRMAGDTPSNTPGGWA